jgi:hypothetical protein
MSIESIIFDFNNLLSLVDLKKHNQEVIDLLNYLTQNDPHFSFNSPMEEDIILVSDRWEIYHSPSFGFTIEFLDESVSNISFQLRTGKNDDETEKSYTGKLGLNLINCKNRKDVLALFGNQIRSGEFFDQYHIEENKILGFLYDLEMFHLVTHVSFGSKRIFSDPDLIPNRYSPVFVSLENCIQ